jgi:hypothetical protein
VLNKIDKEIDDFANTIKEVKGCDEMLDYMNSNIYSSVKLLMFASKTFSLYGKIILFIFISIAGLSVLSSIASGILNSSFLIITLFLFVLILVYVMHFRKNLCLNIEKVKSFMKKDEQ